MNKFDYEAIEEYQLEITTYCNAACPQCPRNVNGGKVNPYLNVCHLDSNIIDKAFPEDLCRRLTQVFFCGSYEDEEKIKQFLEGVDVVTFEFENIPIDILKPVSYTHLTLPTNREV